jgi:hypothetical protein
MDGNKGAVRVPTDAAMAEVRVQRQRRVGNSEGDAGGATQAVSVQCGTGWDGRGHCSRFRHYRLEGSEKFFQL